MIARLVVVRDRLARTTPRERLLLGGLVLGALIYAPIALMEWRSVQEDRYLAAAADRSAARLARSAARRVTASAPNEAALEDMRSWGFEASNVAVAQVRIEQLIVEAGGRAGLTNLKVTADAEPETIGPIQWLGTTVEADLKWGPTFAFLDAMTAWPEGFRITSFAYELAPVTQAQAALAAQGLAPAGPTGRMTIGVSVPVRLPAEAAAAVPATGARP